MDDPAGGAGQRPTPADPAPGDPPSASAGMPAGGPTRPSPPDGPGGPGPGERAHGIALETCYRHPQTATGVHCTRCGRPICVECMRPAAVGYQCPECMGTERKSGYSYQRGVSTTSGIPPVTRALLLITIGVFVVELVVGATQLFGFGGDAYQLVRLGAGFAPQTAGVGRLLPSLNIVPQAGTPELWRFGSAMFLHLGLIHIAFNMYALFLLGPPIERAYGHLRFLALYLVTGIMGNIVSFAFGSPVGLSVGASTAVFGLLGVWLAYNYRRRENAFHQANVRAVLITLVINLVLNLSLSSLIDWRGHVGGFVAGAILGYTAEGIGSGAFRRASVVLGFAAVLGVGAFLVVYRIHQLQTLFT